MARWAPATMRTMRASPASLRQPRKVSRDRLIDNIPRFNAAEGGDQKGQHDDQRAGDDAERRVEAFVAVRGRDHGGHVQGSLGIGEKDALGLGCGGAHGRSRYAQTRFASSVTTVVFGA